MKKIFGIFGIILILSGSTFITPSLGVNVEDNFEDLELKILFVICGRIKVCMDEKELYGFGLIVYNGGETSVFERYNIKFQGFPFFVNNGILISFCIYIPADI